MNVRQIALRFLIPQFVVRLLYFIRFRAMLAPRVEVEYSKLAQWGRWCVIGSFTKVKISGPFIMGKQVHIGTGCFIGAGPGGLRIGDDALLSPNCAIVAGSYNTSQLGVPLRTQGPNSRGITIGHRVWIGANAVVLDGSEIGDDVIVTAGSVVSGSIPKNSIVQGSPARVIFTRR